MDRTGPAQGRIGAEAAAPDASQPGQSPHPRVGRSVAIELLLLLAASNGQLATGEALRRLAIARSTLHRITRILEEYGLLDLSVRGILSIGPTAARLALRREEQLREEDERRLVPRHKRLTRAPGASYVLLRNEACAIVSDTSRFRRTPKFRLGFSNASIDHPWRTALVHSVEYGAVRHERLVSSLAVHHAGLDAARQIADIRALLEAGIDGLVLSAHESEALVEVIGEAERRGVPTVLVDRGRPDILANACFVTCDDRTIGEITARWLSERLRGHGSILLLPGLFDADPAHRRLEGAVSVFSRYPGIHILDIGWTGWQQQRGREIVAERLARGGTAIDGVWCDSGLQAVGSLKAFIAAGRSGSIPPHTGGDLNLAYKLAIRHGVALAAVDYPPAMGLRSVDVLLDVLRGRSVPRRVDVATEIVVTRGHATRSVRPDLWADEHVRWDLPDDLILASGLWPSYDPRSFRIHYKGNRYNRSAAIEPTRSAENG
jgi:ABC-type sugar transport system substrate-binding protein